MYGIKIGSSKGLLLSFDSQLIKARLVNIKINRENKEA